jgi:SNF2 family DNA or RNA helicase
MIVDTQRRRLVYHLRDPDKALSVIPTARPYDYKGKRLVVVPHGMDETRVLLNLGLEAPMPVECYYDWPHPPGQPPFAVQRATTAFLTRHSRGYVLNDIGTGKTRSALWAYDYLRKEGLARAMLVVAPLSTLENVWADELFRNFPHLSFQVVHGSRAARLKKLATPADVYIINHDGFPPRPESTFAQRQRLLVEALSAPPAVERALREAQGDAVTWFDALRRAGATKALSLPPAAAAVLNQAAGTLSRGDALDPEQATRRFMTTLLRAMGVTQADESAALEADPSWAVLSALLKKAELDVLCIDELDAFRSAATDRWRAINELARKIPRVWGMTGTPIPNAPTDAWAQCRLVTPSTTPVYFGRFRETVMYKVSTWRWEPKPDALDVVYQTMRPHIRFTRDACVDLPPTLYKTLRAEMSPRQAMAYRQMFNALAAEAEEGRILAVNEANKVMKLVQIGCGAAYTEDGAVARMEAPRRIGVVLEVIARAAAKVIVFVPFTGALEYVRSELAKHHTVAVVQGATSKNERARIFRDFMREADPRVLVANPDAMSHGLTLVAADTIIWYAPTTSTCYGQANGRITRPGQSRTTLICHIESSPVERRIYERQARRDTMQGILLDLFAQKTN